MSHPPTRIFIQGTGAVSPAGWGVPALMEALDTQRAIPSQPLKSPGADFQIRAVPAPNPRPAFLAHPRLRRASVISQYATAAALEALQNSPFMGRTGVSPVPAGVPPAAPSPTNQSPSPSTSTAPLLIPNQRLAIVLGVHAASIRYSERFFGEVLKDPATASPVLFPETVINAPASHLAAALNSTRLTYSVLGDQTAFIQALIVGAGWLAQDRADIVLVISSEETAWTVSSAAQYFGPDVICSEGAGALCLTRDPAPNAIELAAITHPALYTQSQTRTAAIAKIASEFFPSTPKELLIDSRTNSPRWDESETNAWRNWPGPTLSPRATLGEALSAATAWQFIAATARLRAGKHPSAVISAAGSNQQALAARLSIPT